MKSRFSLTFALCVLTASSASAQNRGIPKAADARLVVELVARDPDIVHPVSCDFDPKGRLLVIESHTHFAPKDYKGPKFDRIRAFDVNTGKATTFFEGTRHTMDLAVNPDGAVYLATRNEILRLRENKNGEVKSERIVFLDTKGDYPHNGLSGLCFDFKGDLTFGMGENLGAKYALIGSDGAKFTGEGDGGHIFHCTADGKKLRKVATGFWNPFGICRDIYGRTFAVDNDPDQAPPCRMLHVVEGGDYGFRFCYGRSGKHPFQSWHGELPGTLPMMTGVGEAPCEILSYESDGLPKEYLGQLLVTSWADHRVERYQVEPHGASFKAKRLPFVQGGPNFRPVGMCVAPDGSLYITDWVLSNYTLHGKGAIWRIHEKDAKTSRDRKGAGNAREALFSLHRPLREAAAKTLAQTESGRTLLIKQVKNSDARIRVAAITGLLDGNVLIPDLVSIAEKDESTGIRELVTRALVSHPDPVVLRFFETVKARTVHAESIRRLHPLVHEHGFLRFLASDDPFLRAAALDHLTKQGWFLSTDRFKPEQLDIPTHRIGLFLHHRRRVPLKPEEVITYAEKSARGYLFDLNEEIRFLAAKWIADEKLKECRKDVEKAMLDPKLSVRVYTALATALARIDGKDVNEKSLADYFANRLTDDKTPPAQRAMLLKQVPATHPKLTIALLRKLSESSDEQLQFEAVRALVDHPDLKRATPLLLAFRNAKLPVPTRGLASLGLSGQPAVLNDEFLESVAEESSPLRDDVLRLMIGNRLTDKQVELLSALESKQKSVDGIRRVLGKPFFRDRPAAKDTDAWLKRLEGKADADAGARVFFHSKVGTCSKCHRIDGRGADVGPDLSHIGRTERRHILESILQPSNTVAPHYVAWHLETADGKVKSGMLIHTQLDEYTYLDANGERFKVKTGDLAEQRPLATSIMPEGLIDRMSDQELMDLLAYLQSRK